jgi:hypothetical protein
MDGTRLTCESGVNFNTAKSLDDQGPKEMLVKVSRSSCNRVHAWSFSGLLSQATKPVGSKRF